MKLTADTHKPSLRIILTSLAALAVCGVYAGLWAILWEVSQAFWFLPAGLRFVVFMYTRPKYWPIWIVGELLGIAYLSVVHHNFPETIDVIIASIMPLAIYLAVIVSLLRKRAWAGQTVVKQRELALIIFAIIIAAMGAAISLFLLMPSDSPNLVFEKYSIRGVLTYAIGDIAGILFVWSSVEFTKCFRVLDKSAYLAFIRDAFYLIIPVVGILGLIAALVPRLEWAFLAMLFLPIVFLSLRHGWVGATFSLVVLNMVAGAAYWLSGNTDTLYDAQILVLSVGITGLFLGSVISHQTELIGGIREISQRLITTQETERNRISQDLHDHVGQVLTALRSRIAILRQRGPDDLNDEIDVLDQLAAEAYRDVHEIVGELSPRDLSHFGLKRSLDNSSFQGMLQAANISYSTSIDDRVNEISEQLQIAAFRISQEALSNIAKHSQATECSIKIDFLYREGRKTVHIQIQDNGVGFDANSIAIGHGLQHIEDRVQALVGNYHLRAGKFGTLLDITLPI